MARQCQVETEQVQHFARQNQTHLYCHLSCMLANYLPVHRMVIFIINIVNNSIHGAPSIDEN